MSGDAHPIGAFSTEAKAEACIADQKHPACWIAVEMAIDEDVKP